MSTSRTSRNAEKPIATEDNLDSISGNGYGIFNFFSNLLKRWSGSGMTNSEIEAAHMQQNMAQENALLEQQLSLDTWRQTQSYESRVADMKNAGINPALMMGGSAGSAPSLATSASVAAPNVTTSGASGLSDFLGLIDMAMNASALKSENKLRDAQSENLSVSTSKTSTEDRILQIDEQFAKIKNWLSTQDAQWTINNRIKDVEVKDGQLNVMGSQISLNLADVNLKDKQALVAEADASIKRLDAKKAETLLPYAVDYLKLDMQLKESQTLSNYADIELKHANALVAFAEASIKEGLIEGDYITKFLDNIDADSYAKNASGFNNLAHSDLANQQTKTSAAYANLAEQSAKLSGKQLDYFVADKIVGYLSQAVTAFCQLGNTAASGVGAATSLLPLLGL